MDYKTGELSPDRIKRLEQLGFVWNPNTAVWEKMFAALTAYKVTYGDCNVPEGWKDICGALRGRPAKATLIHQSN